MQAADHAHEGSLPPTPPPPLPAQSEPAVPFAVDADLVAMRIPAGSSVDLLLYSSSIYAPSPLVLRPLPSLSLPAPGDAGYVDISQQSLYFAHPLIPHNRKDPADETHDPPEHQERELSTSKRKRRRGRRRKRPQKKLSCEASTEVEDKVLEDKVPEDKVLCQVQAQVEQKHHEESGEGVSVTLDFLILLRKSLLSLTVSSIEGEIATEYRIGRFPKCK
jgi:hypothetical protein